MKAPTYQQPSSSLSQHVMSHDWIDGVSAEMWNSTGFNKNRVIGRDSGGSTLTGQDEDQDDDERKDHREEDLPSTERILAGNAARGAVHEHLE